MAGDRPRLAVELVDLAWLVGAGLIFFASLALGPVAAWLPGPAAVPTVVFGLALDLVLFLWMFRALTNVALPWRDHRGGRSSGRSGSRR